MKATVNDVLQRCNSQILEWKQKLERFKGLNAADYQLVIIQQKIEMYEAVFKYIDDTAKEIENELKK